MTWQNRFGGARTLLLATLATTLAACTGTPGVTPPPAVGPGASPAVSAGASPAGTAAPATSGPTTPPRPTASLRPTPGSSAPSSAPAATPGPIQLLDATSEAASVLTATGKQMTLVASAAANGSTSAPMHFAVAPFEGTSRAYALQQAAAAEGDQDLPWRSGFTANRALGEGGDAAAPRRLMQLAGTRAVGSEQAFWVNTGDSRTSGDRQQTCVLMRVTDHAYFYIDKEAKVISDANLDTLVAAWEERIYPRLTAVFGPEARPGIDGEDRVFIVLSPAVDNWGKEKGLMGYFWSRDAIPGGGTSHSNQMEVLFMTDQLFDRPALTSFGTLAHEFQHLINFSQKAARLKYRLAEDTWLDEGLSMYAMEVAGYGLPAGDYHIAKDLRGFQENPADYSLTDWAANPNGFAYGQVYLFVRYLVDRYGADVVRQILASDKAGVDCVEGVLGGHGTTFAENFRAWGITNLVSDWPVAAGTPYRYAGLPLAGTFKSSTGAEDIVLRGFQAKAAPGAEVAVGLKPWGTTYYRYEADQAQAWRLTWGAGSQGRLLGAAIVP